MNAPYINGEFYVIGGETVNGAGATADKVYKRVDIYNPSTNSWRRGADMLTGKHGIYPIEHAGKIYVPGGGIKSGKSESAILEIYHPAPPSGLAPLSLSMLSVEDEDKSPTGGGPGCGCVGCLGI